MAEGYERGLHNRCSTSAEIRFFERGKEAAARSWLEA